MSKDNAWRDELLWAGGLFEGEGTFAYSKSGRPPKRPTAQARLGMTDRDSVERFQRAMGFGNIYVHKPGTGSDKPLPTWSAYGFEHVQAVVAYLWSGLGERRRAKAREMLLATRLTQARGQRPFCPQGHPYEGDNLMLEPIRRGGRTYMARRCRICRQLQNRERMRRKLGTRPDRYRTKEA